jgi:hypothetical protein
MENDFDVVPIHQHMTDDTSSIIFLHYWGRGRAEMSVRGIKAALDELGTNATALSMNHYN